MIASRSDYDCRLLHIWGIQFTLERTESSVFAHDMHDKFGILLDPDAAILDAIESKRPDYLKGRFVKGKAWVSYFTGDWDVLPRFDTVLGTVRVGRSMQLDTFGRTVGHTQHITVAFGAPTTLEDAWEKMREIRQFFGWMMGYAPGWKDVFVITSQPDEHGVWEDANSHIEVFGPNEWRKVPDEAKQCGTLIDASEHPDHFMEVMKKWLKRNSCAERKSANARFFSCFPGISSRAIEDGIVSAANTFDLLPREDKPRVKPLPDDVTAILEDARNKVKASELDGTPREDVLNALGRIQGNRRLRDIVEHRAKIVLNRFGEHKLPQLEESVGLAVKCRNHYTHGPSDQGDTDYADLEVVLFLTKTLEFIYGASELLLCGWDPGKSVRDEWHPLGGYVKFYDAKCGTVLNPQ